MVVDAILYNGEEDIFKLRYEILKDYVDEFIVCEFGETFSGNNKIPHLVNLPKVSYHFFTKVKDWQQDLPPAFSKEYNQREMIKSCLTHLNHEDMVYIGDCDEIWNPKISYPPSLCKLKFDVYAYYLNNRSDEDFKLGTISGKYKFIKEEGINTLRSSLNQIDGRAGWHFTNMGGLDKLKYKIESYGHQEFNTPQIKNNLELQLNQNKDYIGRDFKMWIDESDWPPWLKEHRQEFINMLK